MFELPNAKRVKRSKLFAADSSSEDEADNIHKIGKNSHKDSKASSKVKSKLEDTHTQKADDIDDEEDDDPKETHSDEMQIDYGFEYEFIDKTQPTTTINQQEPQIETIEEEPKEQTFAFNLFAPKPKPKTSSTTTPIQPKDSLTTNTANPAPTNTITIRSPTPSDPHSTSSRNILHSRPQSYYFTSALPAPNLSTLQSQYQVCAITPATLHSLATQSWPGTHLPWRIVTLPSNTSTHQSKPAKTANIAKKGVRTRPSKKRRIMKRRLLAAREEAKRAGAKAEEEEREKRTRRNREKKVKRKMREKAKKLATAGVGGDAGKDPSESHGGDSGSDTG